MVRELEIRFLRFEGRRVAYAVSGAGPPLVAPAWWVSHLDLDWRDRAFRSFWAAVGEGYSLVRYDGPGVGMSDRDAPPRERTLEREVAFEARGDLLGASPLDLAVFMRTFAPACTVPVEQPPGGGDPPGGEDPPRGADPPRGGDPPAGGAPPGDDDPTGPAPDRTAPRVRLLAATATRAGVRRTPLRVQLRLTSSEAGLLRVRFERVRPGRTVRHGQRRSCRATRRPVRRGHCRAFTSFAVLTRTIAPGTTRLVLPGRIGRRSIRPGTYRLTATVRDAAGNVSAPSSLTRTAPPRGPRPTPTGS